MLIISSDTELVYEKHRKVWRSYMNKNPYIESYFIQYRDGPSEIEGDIFWLTGKESFQGIITKTIDSIEYFLNKDSYDFIIRTNMSSLWNFKALLSFLETIPKEGVYCGIIGEYFKINYISGSGFIMTPDVAKILVKNRAIAEKVKIIDDVDIGYCLEQFGISRIPGKRVDFFSMGMYLTYNYDPSVYHYRLKWNNYSLRHEEADAMMDLLSKF